MADYSKQDAFNSDKGLARVKFGRGTSLLEIELDEMQKILQYRLESLVRGAFANGFLNKSSMTVSAGTLTLQPDTVYVNGKIIEILEPMTLAVANNDVIYLAYWEQVVTYQDSLKKGGNLSGGTTISNSDTFDAEINKETARRVQQQIQLTKTNLDNTKNYFRIASISSLGVLNDERVKYQSLADISPTKVIQDANNRFFTDTERAKLNGISTGANKVETSTTNGNIKIDGTEKVVYSHPSTHSLDVITETTTKKIMTDAERTKLSGISTGATKTINSATNGNINIDGTEQVVYTHPATHSLDVITETTTKKIMTDTERTKLAGISSGAEVNQNAFSNFLVGATTISADSKTDTFEFVGGTGISLTGDATNDKLTIAVTMDDSLHGSRSGGSLHAVATQNSNGFISSGDKTKLDGISSGANKVLNSTTNGNILIDGSETVVYSHPTTDGNLHVPANGTTNNGKLLRSGATAGSLSWGTLGFNELTGTPTTLGGYGITDAVPSSDVVNVATASKILRLDTNSKLPADITGNSATATKLATARTLSLTTDATGSGNFDGSGNLAIAVTLANSGVTAGTYPKVTVDAKGRVTSGSSLVASDIPSLDWSKITSGKPTTIAGYGITDNSLANLTDTTITTPASGHLLRHNGTKWVNTTLVSGDIPSLDWSKITSGKPTTLGGYGITDAVSSSDVVTVATANKLLKLDASGDLPTDITGNSATATKLSTARTLSLTSDITGSASFDGSANASITATLANSGVTAGTYTKITVDAKGRATSGTTLVASDIPALDWSKITSGKPTTLSGYGITDASLVNLTDTTITTPATGHFMRYNGTKWVNTALATGDIPSLDWSKITSGKPTTLSGYGITDGAPSSHVGATGTAHGVASTAVAGFMSSGDKSKLDGIAMGAEVNQTAFSKVIAGGTTLSSTLESDTLTFTNGVGISMTGSGKAVTVAVTMSDSLHGSRGGGSQHSVATTGANGFMSSTDKSKLDGMKSTISATLPATAGWYRIAQSSVDIARNFGRFEVDWTASGVHGQVVLNAGIMYGVAASTALNQVFYSNYGGQGVNGLTQARIVYNTTYTGNYAYLEVYNQTASAITVNVDLLGSMGWSLVTPSTAGSIPTGYTTNNVTFANGIATTDQLVSQIATGTAPLVVNSTTAVTNLNADMVDGVHLSGLVQTSRNVATGVGLTGGGNLSADRTLAVNFSGTGSATTVSRSDHSHSLTLSGDATGSVTLDNTADTMAVTLANSGVTAGTYKSVTVDAKGRVTGGTNPTTLAGYGIMDGALETVTISAGTGLTGGGNLTANRTLAVDFYDGIDSTSIAKVATANSAKMAYDSAIAWVKGLGLGDVADDITSTDLNSLDVTGFYKGYSLVNAPTFAGGNTSGWMYIIHIKHDASWKSQTAIDFSTGQTAYRVNNGGTWTAWTQTADRSWVNSQPKLAPLSGASDWKLEVYSTGTVTIPASSTKDTTVAWRKAFSGVSVTVMTPYGDTGGSGNLGSTVHVMSSHSTTGATVRSKNSSGSPAYAIFHFICIGW